MVEHSERRHHRPRRAPGLRRRDLLLLAGSLAVLGVAFALVIGAGVHGGATVPGAASTTAGSGRYEGQALSRPESAPALSLHNYLGTPVNIRSYRGRAVLVTFLYTHCPDVCPLIASHLHTALLEMPAAERRRLQIIAVSVDPRGDTPASVRQFLAAHEMTGQMQYLIGSATALRVVWRAWGIASAAAASASNPELVAHTALVYGITAQGKIRVIYQANFEPTAIVHDAALLASS
jgi:protein SCO1/2